MSKSQEEIICTFFANLAQANYDKAKDFMEKQRPVFLSNAWPKSLFDILCDFALAEKNYSDINFEPAKNKMLVRKEDENYLDFVYKTLFQDLEKLKVEVENDYIVKLIIALLHYISIRLKLLEFYNKLYEIGLLNYNIDFSILVEFIKDIQNETSDPSPIDGLVRILQYELDSMKYLFICHEQLENWLYLESLLSMKRGSDAIVLWEKCYQNKETWRFGTIFSNKSPLPALILWFKRFKIMTASKFTLYFYRILLQNSSVHDIKILSVGHNVHYLSKMQQLQKRSESENLIFMFDTTGLSNYAGPGYVSPLREDDDNLSIKYQVMLSFPKFASKLDIIEKLITDNNEDENSMNKISLIFIENLAFLLIRVDPRITLIMYYDSKPKNEEREKANAFEFITLLRCHKTFASMYK